MKKIYYTEEQVDEIERNLTTILSCIEIGGLAPYQADVLTRRTKAALDVLKKGKTE